MTLPSVLFGFLLASLLGSLFHLWKGGKFGRLILYLFLAWIGFWLGHLAGSWLNIGLGRVGPLNLLTALIGCVALLWAGYWISLVKPQEPAS
jgi:hypothetical protein